MSNQKGMSLIETMIMIAILSLIIPVILYFLWGGIKLNRRTSGTIINQQTARQALDKLNRELREITTGDNNQYPLQTCGPLEIAFFSDVDLDDAKELLRYVVSDEQLLRGVIEPSGSPATYPSGNEVSSAITYHVLNDGSSPLFEYYSSSYIGTGSALTQPVSCPEVRMVKVNFKIDTAIELQPGPFELSSKIQLRNLKNNL